MDGSPAGGSRTGADSPLPARPGLVLFPTRSLRRVTNTKTQFRVSSCTANQEVVMSVTDVHDTSRDASVGRVDMKLEVMIIPVSDVERSKESYERLGWNLDRDVAPMEGLRIVQFTPPGSGTSVTFGKGLTTAAPGSAEGELVVSDIEAAYDELVGRG